MEIKCEYSEKEVDAMVLEVHKKSFPAPEGMEWHCVSKTYGGAEVVAIKIKDKEVHSEQTEVTQP